MNNYSYKVEIQLAPNEVAFTLVDAKTQCNVTTPINHVELVDKMRDINYGVPMSHNSTITKSYPYSFSGKCIINWLHDSYFCKRFTRPSCVQVAQSLLLSKQVIELASSSSKRDSIADSNKRSSTSLSGTFKRLSFKQSTPIDAQQSSSGEQSPTSTNSVAIQDSSKVFYRYTKQYRRKILVIGGGFAGTLLHFAVTIYYLMLTYINSHKQKQCRSTHCEALGKEKLL